MAQLRKNWSDKRHPSQILKFDFHRWSVTAKTLISLYEVKNILLRHQDQSEIRAFIFEHLPTESCLPKRGWTRELSGDEARIAHNFGVWCSSIHFKSSGCWRPSLSLGCSDVFHVRVVHSQVGLFNKFKASLIAWGTELIWKVYKAEWETMKFFSHRLARSLSCGFGFYIAVQCRWI